MTEEAKEAMRAYKREWAARNREKVNASNRRWANANKDRVKAINERYWEKKAAELQEAREI